MKSLFRIRKDLDSKINWVVISLSFALPILLWCAVSYLPFIWHPMVKVTDAGASFLLEKDQVLSIEDYEIERIHLHKENKDIPKVIPSNPVYLPAPHEVVKAFYTSFTTKPKRRGEPWLHESLLHSVRIVFLAFFYSSLIGIPLGILVGSFSFFTKLIEPFVEFFRYLPAPAFGALAVAIFGINDAPKMTIIVIGTLFQQILIIGTTVRSLDISLIEAAQTLGAKTSQLIFKVIIPGVLPRLYKDMRILLGWAWTYLIVAEVIGASTGITWFINQQAKYRVYENVYAAIIMIGIIGLVTDFILAFIGRNLFVWEDEKPSVLITKIRYGVHWFFVEKKTFFP